MKPSAVRDVYLIVRDLDGRVLLLLREGTGYKDGEWGPPSGKVEADESYEQAAVRELREETGLVAAPSALRFLHAIERLEDGPSWVGVFFELDLDGTPVNLEPDKHRALEWFAESELPHNSIGYFAHVVQCAGAGLRFSEWTE